MKVSGRRGLSGKTTVFPLIERLARGTVVERGVVEGGGLLAVITYFYYAPPRRVSHQRVSERARLQRHVRNLYSRPRYCGAATGYVTGKIRFRSFQLSILALN